MILTVYMLFFFAASVFRVEKQHDTSTYPIATILQTTNYRLYNVGRELSYTVLKEWESLKVTIKPFKSNDSLVVEERPYPAEYVQNQDVRVCQRDTYLVLLYPSRVKDAGIRKFIRKNVPQGIVIKGRKVNRVFVIAVRNSDKESMLLIRKEKEEHGDIIISPHQDSLAKLAQSVWDGFLWIRNHCSHAVFAIKADPDEVIFLGNLINYLSHVPARRFYGGNYREFVMKARKEGDDLVYFPKDYPYSTKVYYVSGGLVILTVDIIDYLIVGAKHEPFFGRMTDDFMIGAVLNRVGISPQAEIIPNCTLFIDNNPIRNLTVADYNRVSHDVVVYHRIKKEQQLEEALRVFGKRIFKPTGCSRICFTRH